MRGDREIHQRLVQRIVVVRPVSLAAMLVWVARAVELAGVAIAGVDPHRSCTGARGVEKSLHSHRMEEACLGEREAIVARDLAEDDTGNVAAVDTVRARDAE